MRHIFLSFLFAFFAAFLLINSNLFGAEDVNVLMQKYANTLPPSSVAPETQSASITGDAPKVSQPLPTSPFEAYVAGKEVGLSTQLDQFGYRFFSDPAMFSTGDRGTPVGPEYVIGPGDSFTITVWGKFEARWSVTVERDGSIVLPKLGVLPVAGLTFGELKPFLQKSLLQYYTGFDLAVSMSNLRLIRVYMVGNVKNPGTYMVSSLGTLVTALFQSGGPSKSGSLRRIEVKRNGKTVQVFDMYRFLLKGDKSQDMKLQPEDVLFIPPVGPLVGIAGSVHTPAIYELNEEKTIQDLVTLSGGLDDLATQKRIQILRVQNRAYQSVLESSLDASTQAKIQGGDIVKIFSAFKDNQFVQISGAVYAEGGYGLQKTLSLKELLSLAGGTRPEAYLKDVEVTRLFATQDGPIIQRFHLDLSTLESTETGVTPNILLQNRDHVTLRFVPEWAQYGTATISGEVRFPGTYTLKKGEKLSSLIRRAGGFTEKAYPYGSVFSRESAKVAQQASLDQLKARFSIEQTNNKRIAQSALSKEATDAQLQDLSERDRVFSAILALQVSGRIPVNVETSPLTEENDLVLENNDSLFIPKNPGLVFVSGQITNPGTFVFSGQKTSKDYIDLAGGFNSIADPDKILILHANGTVTRDNDSFFWFRNYQKLRPGDSVLVSDKSLSSNWLRDTKDVITILYQSAVVVGVLKTIL